MRRKSALLAMVLGVVLLLAASVNAGSWIKDSVFCVENDQTVYEWWYMTPVLDLGNGTVSMALNCYYTDYGRKLRGLPNIKRSFYVVQMNLATNQLRFFSADRFDFDNNKIWSSEPYPNGKEWETPTPGTMAARWIAVARTLPKSDDLSEFSSKPSKLTNAITY